MEVAPDIAKSRLIERHVLAGIEKTIEAAAARVEENDARNGDLIRDKLIKPDLLIFN